ncbi:MAG: hypothetical protein IK015_07885 [Treponema sp.]|nr:hypothetical protein [Treponema sp.]
MKKLYVLLSAALVAICCLSCKQGGDTYIVGAKEKTFPVKITTMTKKKVAIKGIPGQSPEVELGFMEGKEDIPYVRLNNEMFSGQNIEVSAYNAATNKFTFTNTARNTKAELDLTKHKLTFENYDLFFQSGEKAYLDPTGSEKLGNFLKITDAQNIAGVPITLDWSTQDIDVVIWQDGNNYDLAAPLQFYNDVFGSVPQSYLLYNGKNLYIAGMATDDFWTEGNQSGTRSAALAEFCYNELCLNMDFNYGLKAIHGIDKFPDFDTYFKYVGIKDSLKSQDARTFASAITDVCEFFFGDGHSNYSSNSHYLPQTESIAGARPRKQNTAYWAEYKKYMSARIGITFDFDDTNTHLKKPAYIKSGDTAIVRFDHFGLNSEEKKAGTIDHDTDFGSLSNSNSLINNYVYFRNDTLENTYDTPSLIHYVNNLIKADSSIKNVVIDLSCNGGGAIYSAAFVLSWMLGECTLQTTNPITGAKWSVTYKADVNGNGTPGEDADTIKGKNLFCLISPTSFSCGNLVPAMLKASDRVTILGVTSGGGTGMVQNSSAADGTCFRMSSKWIASVQKNGSNYDIDKGVEPHFFINDPANFYNAATIDALVKSINEAKLGN